jgi:hypothetical protein
MEESAIHKIFITAGCWYLLAMVLSLGCACCLVRIGILNSSLSRVVFSISLPSVSIFHATWDPSHNSFSFIGKFTCMV